jgi:hypothetical protein
VLLVLAHPVHIAGLEAILFAVARHVRCESQSASPGATLEHMRCAECQGPKTVASRLCRGANTGSSGRGQSHSADLRKITWFSILCRGHRGPVAKALLSAARLIVLVCVVDISPKNSSTAVPGVHCGGCSRPWYSDVDYGRSKNSCYRCFRSLLHSSPKARADSPCYKAG